ncbi:zwei Ig domain protein zig-8-like isoform X2 [Panulirus ornatus]|uniref:zwei Ig domain protein zig-8-like isoform X2 n=1 Tax=Panulirus ornatus TaxID=150431 RepID=UPI003A85333A
MDRILLLVAACVAAAHLMGVSGRRHNGGDMSHSKHRRRDLVDGAARDANLEPMTPEQQNNTEVVAQVGGTATIKCYTHFLGDETVTWLKRDEEQLLTAGGQVYSSESRYSVSHVRHQKLWELSVRNIRLSDAGQYECQLTTHPPTSLFFTLKVVEAVAVIVGGPEIHVHTGVKLRLHCNVELATEDPQYIFWFHNGSMINFASSRPVKVVKHPFSSSLIISNVTWRDAGSYNCEPHKARSANITLHVIEGEKHAALHNGQNDAGSVEHTNTASDSAHCTSNMLLIGWSLLLVPMTNFVILKVRCRS